MDGGSKMNIYEIFNETNYNLEKETKKIYELLAFALKREKLENVSDKWSLKTVWGVGYKFETK